MTMTLVSTTTLSADAATITFTGLPQTATDIVILLSARSANTSVTQAEGLLRFNGDTGANYVYRYLRGYATTASSGSGNPDNYIDFYFSGGATTANTFGNMSVYILNYAGNTNKSVSIDESFENNAAAGQNEIIAGIWNNTAAITSVSFTSASGNFLAGTMASLYTITKGSGGANVA